MDENFSLLNLLGFDDLSPKSRHIISPNSKDEFQVSSFSEFKHIGLDKHLNWLANFFASKSIAWQLLESIKKHPTNKLSIKSFLGNDYRCMLSFFSEINGANLLIFSGKPNFILVQSVTSCDYLVFPSISLLVQIANCHVAEAGKSGDLVSEAFSYLEQIKAEDFAYSFTGITYGHNRPAHFFYDCLIGMEQCFGSLCDSDFTYISHIATSPGEDFWDLSNVYQSLRKKKILKLEKKKLNLFSKDARIGFIKIAVYFKFNSQGFYRHLMRSADEKLKYYFSSNLSSPCPLETIIRGLKSEGYFIIWFGISTSKRAFKDQEKMISQFSKTLVSCREKVCVIIDGWTNTITVQESKIDCLSNDLDMANRVVSQLKSMAKVYSLVGYNAESKAKISLLIDFHINPCGTSSLWPSRFSQKPGILHTNDSYYKQSIASQIYSFGSSIYPGEGILEVSNTELPIKNYFLSIKHILNWTSSEFPKLFSSNNFQCANTRDAILLMDNRESAKSVASIGSFTSTSRSKFCNVGAYSADKDSHFVFVIHEPKFVGQIFYLDVEISYDNINSDDILRLATRAKHLPYLHEHSFIVENFSTIDASGCSKLKVCVPVLYGSNLLIINPRQSFGLVRFDAIRIQNFS